MQVVLTHPLATFSRATDGSAGFDLSIVETPDILIPLVGTGVRVAIPKGYVGLVFPRSSLQSKGWMLANSVGVIDSDYRGEIKLGLRPFVKGAESELFAGDRVAQLVIVPIIIEATFVDALDDTIRGDGGFGST